MIQPSDRLYSHVRSVLLAFQFLTILPIKKSSHDRLPEIGLSLLYYPFVGAILGVAVIVFAKVALLLFPEIVSATLVVAFWIGLTGALHIDGLADSADAWVGGFGSRRRTLELMKDPTCGPVAVAVVAILVLVKVHTIAELLHQESVHYLIWVPLLGRLSIVALLLTTPYVRQGGLGESLHRHVPRNAGTLLCIFLPIFLLIVSPIIGIALMMFGLLTLWWLRNMMMSRLGGCTGDTVGASLEILETVGLLVLLATLRLN
ncbi:MAG: adenosylcobinamide-GDP ribazoletransferase [Oceanicoccus sp.]|jgi:adenosylcobinamide-GDP ribazoletransferase